MKQKPTSQLQRLVQFCDASLRTREVEDYAGAHNGLQVENSGSIHKIAAAVDASLSTVRLATEAGAELLVVHHGLFWGPSIPWTGRRYELIRHCIQHNLAIYSSHLPLDLHPKWGNNAGLVRALGWKNFEPFFESKGQKIGCRVETEVSRNRLHQALETVLGGSVKLLPGGSEICRSIGVVTGGAGAELAQAASEGVDTFITGEGPHWTYALAEDHGINVMYGGHYATETFGVKSLAAALSLKFKIPWVFIDHPTGL